MSVLDAVANRLGYRKAAPPVPQMLLAMADAERWSGPSFALSENQAELYARLSWVAIAVQFIADAASAQEFDVKRRTGEDLKDIPNHDAEILLSKPNPLMSRSEFLFGTFAYRALTGNAYWYVNAPRGDTAPPAEVWLVPSHKIQPIPDGRSYLAGYNYDPGDGKTMVIPVEQIVHFRRFHPLNPFVGLSPIEALATTAQGDLAMQKWNANFFGKDNAKIPGILAYRDMIEDTTWHKMQAENKREWGGTNRSGPLMMRGAGDAVSWIATAMSQKDMEFLAGRQASKEEILQVFGVPPGLVDKNATEANAQAAKAVFAEYTLWPLLNSIAQTITLRLLPRYGGDLVGLFEDPRKTDRLVDLQEQRVYARVHTIDEIRAQYYEEPPIGDDRGLMLPAEIGIETLLKLEDGKIPEPKPVPEALVPFAGQDNTAEEPVPDEEPSAIEGTEPADDAEAELMKADLLRWQAKSRKRGKVAAFDSEHIPASVKAAVAVAGFDWVARWDALKAKRDPDRVLEERLRKRIAAIFSANGKQWVSAIADKRPVNTEPAMAEMQAELVTTLSRAVQDEAIAQAVTFGIAFDVAEINAAALEWARAYTYELVKGIDATTRKVLRAAVEQFIATPGMTVGQLTDLIAGAVGEARAANVAITETTRAFSAGTQVYQEMLHEAGIEMRRIWRTSADESVCEFICDPLNDQPEEMWGEYDAPPAHPGCRCFTVLEYVKK